MGERRYVFGALVEPQLPLPFGFGMPEMRY
jgi:hypothetical protein